ncbi:MAG: DUF2202 domain-containing protein [Calditrichaeota bacterium]|nr:DUF2202 domain-containing protein [Calditrichota bacterium]
MLSSISDLPLEDISIEESESLSYIREEEKLARDVYIVLFQKWNMRVFNNISGSEQKHTSAIKLLLEKYTLEDPATEEIGLFTNPELQSLYNALISKGDSSLVQALLVGAAIEEIDIIDIQDELDNVIDNQDITIVYENLLSGSANHLRAFVRNLEMSGVDYTPQYLNEETYYHILSN